MIIHDSINVLTLNVCRLNSYSRIDQVHNLSLWYEITVAVLTETEISHELAKTFSIEGYTVFWGVSLSFYFYFYF